MPTFSLDSGLVFERDASFFGRALRQTLEPRAFYVYTPYRDQSLLPNYDSAANDFNFATIYTENAFVGNDRISDNNLLTLGVTTRLLDPITGAEAARFGIAQRLRFKDQQVTLPGGARERAAVSDLLVGASVNWMPQWAFDSTVQFNPEDGRSIRSTIGGALQPGQLPRRQRGLPLQRGSSEQIDVGWQWPLNDLWGDRGAGPAAAASGQGEGRWYSVGRLNYSLRDGQAGRLRGRPRVRLLAAGSGASCLSACRPAPPPPPSASCSSSSSWAFRAGLQPAADPAAQYSPLPVPARADQHHAQPLQQLLNSALTSDSTVATIMNSRALAVPALAGLLHGGARRHAQGLRSRRSSAVARAA